MTRTTEELTRTQLLLSLATLGALLVGTTLVALAIASAVPWAIALVGLYCLVGVSALLVASLRHAYDVARFVFRQPGEG